ncbi:MAG: hypothetical protein EOO38_21255 [Cytophagaceae bacterium]|nr:MAG: hypothetical protein EOO38_21255 [Cytophagaceae bacterium]
MNIMKAEAGKTPITGLLVNVTNAMQKDIEQYIEWMGSAGMADKVAVNSVAVEQPAFITEVASRYGSQFVTVSIDARREGDTYQAYIRNVGLDEGAGANQLMPVATKSSACSGVVKIASRPAISATPSSPPSIRPGSASVTMPRSLQYFTSSLVLSRLSS